VTRIEVHGHEYLLCQVEACLWSAGHTPGERTPVGGLEYACEPGEGTRVCNYGGKAVVLDLPVPENCPHKDEVHELIRAQDTGKTAPEAETLDDYIKRMANEARQRLGLGTSN
jgi:hypothetical protein